MTTTLSRADDRVSATTHPVVDLYARLSLNPDGRLEKIDDQLADCRRVAERHGWIVGEVHIDNSLSAWKRGVRRPGWEALLARLESGAACGVIVYHQDRLMRQPRDLERLLDMAATRGCRVASVYGERDLTNADDRFILRIEVAHACRSSDDHSRRMRRRLEGQREGGVMHGGSRSFGFEGDDRSQWPTEEWGKRVPPRDADGKRVPVPVAADKLAREREAIRTASEDVAAGLPVAPIANAWNEAGIVTANGEQWAPLRVRAVLLRGRNAGLVEHEGVVVGRSGDGDAIVSEELFARLKAVFASRRRGRPNTGRYLASGLIYCGECGRKMTGHSRGEYADGTPRRQYRCPRAVGGCGKVVADARGVEKMLRQFVIDRFSDPAEVAGLAARITQSRERRDEIEDALKVDRETERALGERLGRGEIVLGTFDAAIKPLRARVIAMEAERAELDAADPRDTPAQADSDEVAEDWDQGTDDRRRALLTTALPGYRVDIHRATQYGTFDPRRVAITPTIDT